ncbi:MAG TPA: dihydrolipoyllysine-residue succinyltransferase [candidate division Zixibacteria bacterium]|nr:dihydrolipoyllysine-residue succinyltransferase [candidate division Zixibacteria bacterium]
MPIPIVVPQLGESVVEGTVGKWLKKEGEKVAKDEPIVEIMTDKINVEIPSPKAGVLAKILVPENTVVPIGQEIGILAVVGESVSDIKVTSTAEVKTEAIKVEAKPEVKSTTTVAAEEDKTDQARLSPAVRRLVKENNIDISKIPGTGSGGRITREDILDYLDKRTAPSVPKTTVVTRTPITESKVSATPVSAGPLEEVIPLTFVRKKIAEHMVRSKHTAPHVTTWDEADMKKLVDIREKLKEPFQKKHNLKLTYMPFIMKATIFALKEYPHMNASMTEENMIVKKYYHLGMAVGRDIGLIVVVVRDCDKKSILEITREINELGDKARADKLSLHDIQGSTFTITNAGMFGALASTPIINYPEVGILGIHMIQKRAVVVDDQIVIRPMMTMCLSFDHRLIDGHYAVQFLQRVKYYLESPEEWLLNIM